MAKRLINEGILVIRDGKRVRPTIGKAFDLTADEIKQLEAVRPQAISKLGEVETDAKSVDTEFQHTGGDDGGDLLDGGDATPLDKMDRAELLEIVEQEGVKVAKNASKDKLVAAIEEHRAAEDL